MIRRNFNTVFWGIVLTCILMSSAHGARDIPDNNLSYPVLIKLKGGGSASGFYANDGKSLYLITARHVLFSDQGVTLKATNAELVSYPSDPKDLGKFIITADLVSLQKRSQIRAHKAHDVAIIRLATLGKKSEITFAQGVEFKQKAGEQPLVTASLLTVARKFDDVLQANEVFVFGYPTSIGIEEMKQIDYELPLLRKGIIAGKNPSNKTLVLDATVYYGNSGGPVLQVEKQGLTKTEFRIVGVISQFVPFKEEVINKTYGVRSVNISNSGYAIVTPMDAVLELLWK